MIRKEKVKMGKMTVLYFDSCIYNYIYADADFYLNS